MKIDRIRLLLIHCCIAWTWTSDSLANPLIQRQLNGMRRDNMPGMDQTMTTSSDEVIKILEGDEVGPGAEPEVSIDNSDAYDDYLDDEIGDLHVAEDAADEDTPTGVDIDRATSESDGDYDDDKDEQSITPDDENIPEITGAYLHHYMMFEMGPVDRNVFVKTLGSARSYRDVIRLFHRDGNTLKDEDIDDAMRTEHKLAMQRTYIKRDSDSKLATMESALNHYQEMLVRTKCEQPVAQLVSLRQEFGSSYLEFLPECTVVYRCRNDAGCCASTSQCVARTTITITQPVWELEHIAGHMNLALPTIRLVELVNHTECHCKPLQPVVRCLQCPWPFELREGESCDCQCTQRQYCTPILHGLMPLRFIDIECIQQSKCHIPGCEFGEYDVTSGYCPCQDIDCMPHGGSILNTQYDADDTASGDNDDDMQYFF